MTRPGLLVQLLLRVPFLGHARLGPRFLRRPVGTAMSFGRYVFISRRSGLVLVRLRHRFLICDFDEEHIYYGHYTTRQGPIELVRHDIASGREVRAHVPNCRHVHSVTINGDRLLVAVGDEPDQARLEVYNRDLVLLRTAVRGRHARIVALEPMPQGLLVATDMPTGINHVYSIAPDLSTTALGTMDLPAYSSLKADAGGVVVFGTANENFRKSIGPRVVQLELIRVEAGLVSICRISALALFFPRSGYPEIRPISFDERGIKVQFINCWPARFRFYVPWVDFIGQSFAGSSASSADNALDLDRDED